MTATLAAVIDRLAHELEPLLQSGDNWQLSLHGGRGGDVMIKVERTCQIVATSSQKAKPHTAQGG